MAWNFLIVAGLLEIGWAIGLKYTEGFTRLWPSVGTVLAMILSIGLLGIAMKSLPVGTAYAVWVGVGAVGTVILGIVLLGEPANAGRLVSVGLIVAGRVGLTSPALPSGYGFPAAITSAGSVNSTAPSFATNGRSDSSAASRSCSNC